MFIIPDQKLKEMLTQEDLLSAETFDKLVIESKRMGQNLNDVLVSQGFITNDYLYVLISRYLGVELAGIAKRTLDEKVLKLLSEEVARKKRTIAFAEEPDGSIDVAMEDPSNLETIEFLKKYFKKPINPYLATPDDLNRGFI